MLYVEVKNVSATLDCLSLCDSIVTLYTNLTSHETWECEDVACTEEVVRGDTNVFRLGLSVSLPYPSIPSVVTTERMQEVWNGSGIHWIWIMEDESAFRSAWILTLICLGCIGISYLLMIKGCFRTVKPVVLTYESVPESEPMTHTS